MHSADPSDDVFVILSSDVQRILAENNISLGDIVAQSRLRDALAVH